MAAKKKFTAKQKAAQKLFSMRVKAGDFTKKFKKKSKSSSKTKVKSTKKKSKSMAKGKKGGFSKKLKIPILSSPTFKKAAAGAGVGSLLALVASFIPGVGNIFNQPIVKAIAGFAVGDFIGAAAAFATSGGIPQITGSTGVNNQGGFA